MSSAATQRPHFLFLHGWGQSVQVWHQQNKHFSPLSRVHLVNLPGHGGAIDMPEQQWLEQLSPIIQYHASQQPVVLVGWSLGGQLALALQQQLQHQLAGLVLVSTTPCFRQQEDWQWGCDEEVWQKFTLAAEQQNPKLMQRFFQMMLHGDKLTPREVQHLAKGAINKSTPPSSLALNTGLSFLSKFDFRHNLQDIELPTLIIHGQQDVIVPVQAGQFLAAHMPHAEIHIFEDCGH
ncbi:MAG: alpha/beta fold hydrolase, partial [Ghiorsea sp.]|nr:alpha/beta fold hydrolase [Ghiorsea sp.]